MLSVLNAYRIQGATDDMISDPGEVLDPSASDKDDGVFLEVVADARNIGGHFDSVGGPYARDLAQRRIRLLGSGSVDAGANSALLRAAIQRRARSLPPWRFTPITHKLVKRRHESSSSR